GDDKPDPIPTGFSGPNYWAPDWIILTRAPRPATTVYPVAFSTWDPALADQTPTNNLYAVGRYAYAIYDVGQLLDMNVVGYPTDTSTERFGRLGRKGPIAFADLTALPFPIPNPDASGVYHIDRLVGWRNYGTTQPSNNFPNSA